MLRRSAKFERRAEGARELMVGAPIDRPFSDTITLYGFLAIVVFLFAWMFSGEPLLSLIVVAVVFATVSALTWWARKRRLRRQLW
ncbi:MAG: hypothetical protein M3M94_00550 [Actinomycetota bacterium]|nr:hypothetical protein [Actinomycetota bacterium]